MSQQFSYSASQQDNVEARRKAGSQVFHNNLANWYSMPGASIRALVQASMRIRMEALTDELMCACMRAYMHVCIRVIPFATDFLGFFAEVASSSVLSSSPLSVIVVHNNRYQSTSLQVSS